ncbi:glycosyltransferase family 9 protein [Mycolicibacterium psychrotolerans]|uniref:glycosyltransferase family 9 protein n=1 Tax=Mycolicibacterium psychrotolerans TaxID=216929 RepID=UPI003D669161
MHFAIVQTWGLGDLIMTTPVISEFRRLNPDSKLTLIVRGKPQAALMQGSHLVDQVLTMPPIGDRAAVLKFFLRLRKQHVDVAFIGSRIEGRLPAYLRILAGIPVIVGDGTNKGSRIFYAVRNQIDPEVHRVDRMLETFAMWSRRSPMAARFPIPRSEAALEEAETILADNDLQPGRYVVIHPGSSVSDGTAKRIPAEVARRIADQIVDKCADCAIAFIFGPDDGDLIPSYTGLAARQVILSGNSLQSTIAIISQAGGFIGSDSSLGHIAAAFAIPTITLFGPTIPTETAPYGENARVVRRLEKLECQPCWHTPLYGHCPYGVRCMHELPESLIVETAAAWLSTRHLGRS